MTRVLGTCARTRHGLIKTAKHGYNYRNVVNHKSIVFQIDRGGLEILLIILCRFRNRCYEFSMLVVLFHRPLNAPHLTWEFPKDSG